MSAQPQPDMHDAALAAAEAQIRHALADPAARPEVAAFFDEATNTVSYVVHDPATREAALIDSVLDFDPASGHTAHDSARRLVEHVRDHGLSVRWLLETHAHADHLSAAPWLRAQVGGELAIGRGITEVQEVFGKVFNAEPAFSRDGSQFDRLFADGDCFRLGHIDCRVLHVPGHTPACLAYVIGEALFVGDTLFMPDYGTARCDFPGGSARTLYRSIRRLLSLPEAARVFLCHDYKAPGRDQYHWETTVGAQRTGNVHVRDGIDEEHFVAMREARDATLSMPRLILPSVQVNMRAGQLPPAEDNGVTYLKLPLNLL
ncbi:MBL fold metallo-hydrolase [Pseudomarimonas salicorniae]|uniref:MBL fold metallo-hydrolase n=1 Tax=Pseudomarimonas salicorniae TaxID=2933270 RepID=A0ABT0GLY4_9GAMM|nr:MBL fold metallo-hydrolase [Lysobacter sp. CAU 1642]MCK7595554.1 MBL fold metallo-hydrolase [Lysobacter sp. CAU 1642]